MYLSSLTIHGLSDLPHFTARDLGRTVTIHGPSPAASAVGDGLSLLFGALSERALRRLLVRWALIHEEDAAEVELDPIPTQATWDDRNRAKDIVSDPTNRRLRVSADIVLDPPMAATLRAAAATEPRLGLSLGGTPTIHIEVGAYFGSSWDVLSISVQSIVIGAERFPCAGKERAAWMTALLSDLGKRFINHDQTRDHARSALEALVSPFEEHHSALIQFEELVGNVRPAQLPTGDACLLSDHRPISRLGPGKVRAIHAAASATLHRADIMWMGDPDPWDQALTESDSAPLEQLWTVGNEGIRPDEASGGHRDVLSFGANEE